MFVCVFSFKDKWLNVCIVWLLCVLECFIFIGLLEVDSCNYIVLLSKSYYGINTLKCTIRRIFSFLYRMVHEHEILNVYD